MVETQPSEGRVMAPGAARTPEFYLSILLVAYLFALGMGAIAELVLNFPEQRVEEGRVRVVFDSEFQVGWWTIKEIGTDQGLLLLAALAGIAGSFIHAAQSLASYLGNRGFKASWTVWYLLRPWIGGTLAVIVYLAFRAGLLAGPGAISPYGVTAFGALAGWFSKTTTDKLQEVFETLFKTTQDTKRRDKLTRIGAPVLVEVSPSPVPEGVTAVRVLGRAFLKGATVFLGDESMTTEYVSSEELTIDVLDSHRPESGSAINLWVENPEGRERHSETIEVTFE